MVKVQFNEQNNQAILIDGNNEVVLTEYSQDPKTKKWKYKLPQNSANRQYLDVELLKSKGEITLEYKETRVLGHTIRSKFQIEEWLDDDDQKDYIKLKELIIKLAQKARDKYNTQKNRPLTEIEKLQRQIEKANAKIAQLQKDSE